MASQEGWLDDSIDEDMFGTNDVDGDEEASEKAPSEHGKGEELMFQPDSATGVESGIQPLSVEEASQQLEEFGGPQGLAETLSVISHAATRGSTTSSLAGSILAEEPGEIDGDQQDISQLDSVSFSVSEEANSVPPSTSNSIEVLSHAATKASSDPGTDSDIDDGDAEDSNIGFYNDDRFPPSQHEYGSEHGTENSEPYRALDGAEVASSAAVSDISDVAEVEEMHPPESTSPGPFHKGDSDQAEYNQYVENVSYLQPPVSVDNSASQDNNIDTDPEVTSPVKRDVSPYHQMPPPPSSFSLQSEPSESNPEDASIHQDQDDLSMEASSANIVPPPPMMTPHYGGMHSESTVKTSDPANEDIPELSSSPVNHQTVHDEQNATMFAPPSLDVPTSSVEENETTLTHEAHIDTLVHQHEPNVAASSSSPPAGPSPPPPMGSFCSNPPETQSPSQMSSSHAVPMYTPKTESTDTFYSEAELGSTNSSSPPAVTFEESDNPDVHDDPLPLHDSAMTPPPRAWSSVAVDGDTNSIENTVQEYNSVDANIAADPDTDGSSAVDSTPTPPPATPPPVDGFHSTVNEVSSATAYTNDISSPAAVTFEKQNSSDVHAAPLPLHDSAMTPPPVAWSTVAVDGDANSVEKSIEDADSFIADSYAETDPTPTPPPATPPPMGGFYNNTNKLSPASAYSSPSDHCEDARGTSSPPAVTFEEQSNPDVHDEPLPLHDSSMTPPPRAWSSVAVDGDTYSLGKPTTDTDSYYAGYDSTHESPAADSAPTPPLTTIPPMGGYFEFQQELPPARHTESTVATVGDSGSQEDVSRSEECSSEVSEANSTSVVQEAVQAPPPMYTGTAHGEPAVTPVLPPAAGVSLSSPQDLSSQAETGTSPLQTSNLAPPMGEGLETQNWPNSPPMAFIPVNRSLSTAATDGGSSVNTGALDQPSDSLSAPSQKKLALEDTADSMTGVAHTHSVQPSQNDEEGSDRLFAESGSLARNIQIKSPLVGEPEDVDSTEGLCVNSQEPTQQTSVACESQKVQDPEGLFESYTEGQENWTSSQDQAHGSSDPFSEQQQQDIEGADSLFTTSNEQPTVEEEVQVQGSQGLFSDDGEPESTTGLFDEPPSTKDTFGEQVVDCTPSSEGLFQSSQDTHLQSPSPGSFTYPPMQYTAQDDVTSTGLFESSQQQTMSPTAPAGLFDGEQQNIQSSETLFDNSLSNQNSGLFNENEIQDGVFDSQAYEESPNAGDSFGLEESHETQGVSLPHDKANTSPQVHHPPGMMEAHQEEHTSESLFGVSSSDAANEFSFGDTDANEPQSSANLFGAENETSHAYQGEQAFDGPFENEPPSQGLFGGQETQELHGDPSNYPPPMTVETENTNEQTSLQSPPARGVEGLFGSSPTKSSNSNEPSPDLQDAGGLFGASPTEENDDFDHCAASPEVHNAGDLFGSSSSGTAKGDSDPFEQNHGSSRDSNVSNGPDSYGSPLYGESSAPGESSMLFSGSSGGDPFAIPEAGGISTVETSAEPQMQQDGWSISPSTAGVPLDQSQEQDFQAYGHVQSPAARHNEEDSTQHQGESTLQQQQQHQQGGEYENEFMAAPPAEVEVEGSQTSPLAQEDSVTSPSGLFGGSSSPTESIGKGSPRTPPSDALFGTNSSSDPFVVDQWQNQQSRMEDNGDPFSSSAPGQTSGVSNDANFFDQNSFESSQAGQSDDPFQQPPQDQYNEQKNNSFQDDRQQEYGYSSYSQDQYGGPQQYGNMQDQYGTQNQHLQQQPQYDNGLNSYGTQNQFNDQYVANQRYENQPQQGSYYEGYNSVNETQRPRQESLHSFGSGQYSQRGSIDATSTHNTSFEQPVRRGSTASSISHMSQQMAFPQPPMQSTYGATGGELGAEQYSQYSQPSGGMEGIHDSSGMVGGGFDEAQSYAVDTSNWIGDPNQQHGYGNDATSDIVSPGNEYSLNFQPAVEAAQEQVVNEVPEQTALLSGTVVPPRRMSALSNFSGTSGTAQSSVSLQPENNVVGLGNIGRGDGRRPHAIATFGFGGRLVTMFPQRRRRLGSFSDHSSMTRHGSKQDNSAEAPEQHALRQGHIQVFSMSSLSAASQSRLAQRQVEFPGPLIALPPDSRPVDHQAIASFLQREIDSFSPSDGVSGFVGKLLWQVMLLLLRSDGDLQSKDVLSDLLQVLRAPMPQVNTTLPEPEANGQTESPKSASSSAQVPDQAGDVNNGVKSPHSGDSSAVGGLAGASDEVLSTEITSPTTPSSKTENSLSEEATRSAMADIEAMLEVGDREGAVVRAVESELWAQALVISNFVSVAAYRRVVERFVNATMPRNSQSHSLLLLFAGLGEKALLNTMDNGDGSGSSLKDTWRRTLSSILANRTPGDTELITSLGDRLWSDLGDVRAAHICYLTAGVTLNSTSTSRMVLVGGDHRSFQSYRDFVTPETIERTEIYLYGLSMRNSFYKFDSFHPYRLIYAMWLADLGAVKQAYAWVKSIQDVLKARSPSKRSSSSSTGGSPRRSGPFPHAFQRQLKIFADRLMTCEAKALGLTEQMQQHEDGSGWIPLRLSSLWRRGGKQQQQQQQQQQQPPQMRNNNFSNTMMPPPPASPAPSVGSVSHQPPTTWNPSQSTYPSSNFDSTMPRDPQMQPFTLAGTDDNGFSHNEAMNSRPPLHPGPLDTGFNSTEPAVVSSHSNNSISQASSSKDEDKSPTTSASKKEEPKTSDDSGEKKDEGGWGMMTWMKKVLPKSNVKRGSTGNKLDAYYDKKLGKWVFPGDDPNAGPAAPAAPPKMEELRPSSAPASGDGPAPSGPPQYSAGTGFRRGNTKSRYVNTFAQSGLVADTPRPDTAPGNSGQGGPPMSMMMPPGANPMMPGPPMMMMMGGNSSPNIGGGGSSNPVPPKKFNVFKPPPMPVSSGSPVPLPGFDDPPNQADDNGMGDDRQETQHSTGTPPPPTGLQ